MFVRTLPVTCALLLCLPVAPQWAKGDHRTRADSLHRNNPQSTLAPADRDPALEVQPNLDEGTPNNVDSRQGADGIARSNKASGLIGMEVRNRQNEKLGDIKDVVLDLATGRISYLVLSSGGFLGFGDRLVAIPPHAIGAAPDADHLVLNADKEKLMNAPSFARNNWPDPRSTTAEAYWLSDGEAVGGPGTGVSVGSGSGHGARTATSSEAYENQRMRSRDWSGRTSPASRDDHQVFRGRITAINPETRTMTVEGEEGSRMFTLAERPTLTLKNSRYPHFIDFKVGYPVAVGYEEEGEGQYVAHSITRRDAPELR